MIVVGSRRHGHVATTTERKSSAVRCTIRALSTSLPTPAFWHAASIVVGSPRLSEARVPGSESPADVGQARPSHTPPGSVQGLASPADAHGLPVGASRSPLHRRPRPTDPPLGRRRRSRRLPSGGAWILRAEDPVATSVTIPRASRGHRQVRQRCRGRHEADAGLAETTRIVQPVNPRLTTHLPLAPTCGHVPTGGLTPNAAHFERQGAEPPVKTSRAFSPKTRG